jgi:hypothetical protein
MKKGKTVPVQLSSSLFSSYKEQRREKITKASELKGSSEPELMLNRQQTRQPVKQNGS